MSTADLVLTNPDAIAARRDALRDRLNDMVTGTFELCAVYLGEQLGYYTALAEEAWLTSAQLAARTGTHERYAREWLEEQTLAGIVEVQDPRVSTEARRFRLPPGHAELLADRESINYWASQARITIGSLRPLAAVRDAYRTGGGVPFSAYGDDFRDGMADSTRVAYLQLMGNEWLPAIPDLHARLQTDPPARVADVGMGAGWSSIAIAKAYPKVTVDALDLDPASVELARRNVAESGLSHRVRVELRDAADPTLAGRYDLVTAFFCLHDMAQPQVALRAMRNLVGNHGTVLVNEPSAAETFLDETSNFAIERQYYGFSLVHCLPVAMAEQPSAAIGTVMRPPVMRSLALEAGFRSVDILPIDDQWSTFYRLWS